MNVLNAWIIAILVKMAPPVLLVFHLSNLITALNHVEMDSSSMMENAIWKLEYMMMAVLMNVK